MRSANPHGSLCAHPHRLLVDRLISSMLVWPLEREGLNEDPQDSKVNVMQASAHSHVATARHCCRHELIVLKLAGHRLGNIQDLLLLLLILDARTDDYTPTCRGAMPALHARSLFSMCGSVRKYRAAELLLLSCVHSTGGSNRHSCHLCTNYVGSSDIAVVCACHAGEGS